MLHQDNLSKALLRRSASQESISPARQSMQAMPPAYQPSQDLSDLTARLNGGGLPAESPVAQPGKPGKPSAYQMSRGPAGLTTINSMKLYSGGLPARGSLAQAGSPAYQRSKKPQASPHQRNSALRLRPPSQESTSPDKPPAYQPSQGPPSLTNIITIKLYGESLPARRSPTQPSSPAYQPSQGPPCPTSTIAMQLYGGDPAYQSGAPGTQQHHQNTGLASQPRPHYPSERISPARGPEHTPLSSQ